MAVDQAAIAADVGAKIAAASAAIAAASPLRTATPVALAPARSAVAAAVASIESGIAAIDGDIETDSFAGIVSGTPAPLLWPVLLAQMSDCAQLSRLIEARAYLGRVAANLAGATG
jgi:hypothetical protein